MLQAAQLQPASSHLSAQALHWDGSAYLLLLSPALPNQCLINHQGLTTFLNLA